jgi:hypothetical protein
MVAPTPAGPLNNRGDALVFGADSGTHPITGLPLERSIFADPPDVQAVTWHIVAIAQAQGSAAASAMLTSVQNWLAAGNSTSLPARANQSPPYSSS